MKHFRLFLLVAALILLAANFAVAQDDSNYYYPASYNYPFPNISSMSIVKDIKLSIYYYNDDTVSPLAASVTDKANNADIPENKREYWGFQVYDKLGKMINTGRIDMKVSEYVIVGYPDYIQDAKEKTLYKNTYLRDLKLSKDGVVSYYYDYKLVDLKQKAGKSSFTNDEMKKMEADANKFAVDMFDKAYKLIESEFNANQDAADVVFAHDINNSAILETEGTFDKGRRRPERSYVFKIDSATFDNGYAPYLGGMGAFTLKFKDAYIRPESGAQVKYIRPYVYEVFYRLLESTGYTTQSNGGLRYGGFFETEGTAYGPNNWLSVSFEIKGMFLNDYKKIQNGSIYFEFVNSAKESTVAVTSYDLKNWARFYEKDATGKTSIVLSERANANNIKKYVVINANGTQGEFTDVEIGNVVYIYETTKASAVPATLSNFYSLERVGFAPMGEFLYPVYACTLHWSANKDYRFQSNYYEERKKTVKDAKFKYASPLDDKNKSLAIEMDKIFPKGIDFSAASGTWNKFGFTFSVDNSKFEGTNLEMVVNKDKIEKGVFTGKATIAGAAAIDAVLTLNVSKDKPAYIADLGNGKYGFSNVAATATAAGQPIPQFANLTLNGTFNDKCDVITGEGFVNGAKVADWTAEKAAAAAANPPAAGPNVTAAQGTWKNFEFTLTPPFAKFSSDKDGTIDIKISNNNQVDSFKFAGYLYTIGQPNPQKIEIALKTPVSIVDLGGGVLGFKDAPADATIGGQPLPAFANCTLSGQFTDNTFSSMTGTMSAAGAKLGDWKASKEVPAAVAPVVPAGPKFDQSSTFNFTGTMAPATTFTKFDGANGLTLDIAENKIKNFKMTGKLSQIASPTPLNLDIVLDTTNPIEVIKLDSGLYGFKETKATATTGGQPLPQLGNLVLTGWFTDDTQKKMTGKGFLVDAAGAKTEVLNWTADRP